MPKNHRRLENRHSERENVKISTFSKNASGCDSSSTKTAERLCLSISSMTIFKNNPPKKHPKIPRMRVPFSNNPYSVCKNRLMSSTPGLLLAVSQNCVFSMIIRPKMNFFKRFQLSIFLKFLGPHFTLHAPLQPEFLSHPRRVGQCSPYTSHNSPRFCVFTRTVRYTNAGRMCRPASSFHAYRAPQSRRRARLRSYPRCEWSISGAQ